RKRTSIFASGRRQQATTFRPTRCAKNCRKKTRCMTSLNSFCWARLLISSGRMLASSQHKNPLLKKKKHERIGRKCFAGVDPDGCGADWPGRAQLRYLFAVAQGPHRLYRHADG